MNAKLLSVLSTLGLFTATALFLPDPAPAGGTPSTSGYTILSPIRQGNLTVFPVVAAREFDTAEFLTLDEGLHSGEVIVTESGSVQPLMRRRRTPVAHDGAQVNQLVLVNNSRRPLILLAGEIVTGGKQDRVIGKDRIIPAESDPIDLGVFCVEPGRWVGSSDRFGVGGANGAAMVAPMAAPNVRAKAMADKDQQQVWSEVAKTRTAMAEAVTAGAAAAEIHGTTSYARVMNNDEVKQRVDSVAEPIQRNYQSLIRQLRDQNAVGVVVAVNGQVVWADIFASTNLSGKILAQAGPVLRSRSGSKPNQSRRSWCQTSSRVSEPTGRTPPNCGQRTRPLPSHRDCRRWIQSVRADVTVAKNRLRFARSEDG